MVSREEVNNLATLARLELPAAEAEKLRRDLESILGYVARLKVETTAPLSVSEVRALSDNTLRVDTMPHEAGIYTECLLATSPARRGGYLLVKPIFTNHGH